MAYVMKADGLDEVAAILNALEGSAQPVASMSLYEGAGAMAKTIRSEVNAIRTAPFKYAKSGETRLPSPEEKAILVAAEGMGIATFDKNGSEVNTSVGYQNSGYVSVPWNHARTGVRTNYHIDASGRARDSTYEYRGVKAKPIPVIANAINSGTSFMKKQPFFRRAVQRGTPKAEEAIVRTAEALMEAIISSNGEESVNER
jgi:hypothetical protein